MSLEEEVSRFLRRSNGRVSVRAIRAALPGRPTRNKIMGALLSLQTQGRAALVDGAYWEHETPAPAPAPTHIRRPTPPRRQQPREGSRTARSIGEIVPDREVLSPQASRNEDGPPEETNIPLMQRLLSEGRTEREIEEIYTRRYAAKGKTDPEWVRDRIRTYRKIAIGERSSMEEGPPALPEGRVAFPRASSLVQPLLVGLIPNLPRLEAGYSVEVPLEKEEGAGQERLRVEISKDSESFQADAGGPPDAMPEVLLAAAWALFRVGLVGTFELARSASGLVFNRPDRVPPVEPPQTGEIRDEPSGEPEPPVAVPPDTPRDQPARELPDHVVDRIRGRLPARVSEDKLLRLVGRLLLEGSLSTIEVSSLVEIAPRQVAGFVAQAGQALNEGMDQVIRFDRAQQRVLLHAELFWQLHE